MATKISKGLIGLLVVGAAVAAAYYALNLRANTLPAGLVYGNGRIEATEVDVATKVPGRVADVLVREGDAVHRGQVLARMDVNDVAASLRAAQDAAEQASHAIQEAEQGVRAAQSQLALAQSVLKRNQQLVQRGFLSPQQLDRDRSTVQTAEANLAAARQRVSQAQAGQSAAGARAESVRVTVDDAALTAAVDGRVLYRLVEPGEVLGGGGKALTLIDTSDIFMTFFLPADATGKVTLGSEARIVLDALPDQPIPATLFFVSPRNQFTPKEVETRNEREQMMFRVKVRITADWLAAHPDLAKPGMPGVAYLRLDPAQPWPAKFARR